MKKTVRTPQPAVLIAGSKAKYKGKPVELITTPRDGTVYVRINGKGVKIATSDLSARDT